MTPKAQQAEQIQRRIDPVPRVQLARAEGTALQLCVTDGGGGLIHGDPCSARQPFPRQLAWARKTEPARCRANDPVASLDSKQESIAIRNVRERSIPHGRNGCPDR